MQKKTLSELAWAHAALLERARHVRCACADSVLNLGAAVRLHDAMTRLIPDSLLKLLDPGVVEALSAEGRALAENLDHLQGLWRSDPGSPDIEPLAKALLERIHEHLERNARAVFRPLKRLYLDEPVGKRSESDQGAR